MEKYSKHDNNTRAAGHNQVPISVDLTVGINTSGCTVLPQATAATDFNFPAEGSMH